MKIRALAPQKPYIWLVLAFSAIGTGLSFFGEKGSIGPFNSFLAPILGPWSRCLDPNGLSLRFWDMHDYIWPASLSVILLFSMAIPFPLKNRVLEIVMKFLRYAALAAWCLSGIAKVLIELS